MSQSPTFDYVIAGAGSAGCVLAHRLSEDPQLTVLLLEAGESDSAREIHIPAAAPTNFKTSRDWAYHTEPQERLNGERLYWPRGKVLGGSSAINFMIYIRGNRLDYDGWQTLGCHGWGFTDVLPYFKKAEDQERGSSDYHGVGGPFTVSDPRTTNTLTRAFVEAAVETGFSRNPDFNAAEQDGAGFYQVNQKRGKRQSAASAYLTPIRHRTNLTIRTFAQATKLVIERGAAVGVEYQREGKTEVVRAAREVIVSGGTINSPQLLMRSGIGPADHLRDLDLPVVVDLPGVGQNLQDHLLAPVIYESAQPVSMASAGTLRDFAAYFLLRRGPFTSNIAEAGGFARSNSDLSAPDLQFTCAPVFYMTRGHDMPDGHGFSMAVQMLRPSSRGHVRLRSSDPFDPPMIQPNYLADECDLSGLREGVKRCRQIAQAGPLQPYRGREVWPGPAIQTDAEIGQYIREVAESAYHPVGTCSMGNDATSVVDPMLRVHGIEGLRVVDASVMPRITRGNTNAATVMIGEKASDLIRYGTEGSGL